MERVVISRETKNTKALRKKIYILALNYIKNHVYYRSNKEFPMGFCGIISKVINNDREKFNMYNEKSVYKELKKYRPKTKFLRYWFPIDKEGTKKRIEILEQVISEM
jgi:hypothetical protein